MRITVSSNLCAPASMCVMLAYKTSGLASRRRRWRRAHCCGGQEQAIKAPTQPHRHYPLNACRLSSNFHSPSLSIQSSNQLARTPQRRNVSLNAITSLDFIILPSGMTGGRQFRLASNEHPHAQGRVARQGQDCKNNLQTSQLETSEVRRLRQVCDTCCNHKVLIL